MIADEDSNTGGPSSITVSIEPLVFMFQFSCYELCVGNR